MLFSRIATTDMVKAYLKYILLVRVLFTKVADGGMTPTTTTTTTTTTELWMTNTTTTGSCPSTCDGSCTVTWPGTDNGTKTPSQPPCINSANELGYRECIDGAWGPPPECLRVQPEKPTSCPENFYETVNFCYIFTPKSVFSPSCPFPDVLPFNTFVDLIEISDPIWLPVTRDFRNGIGSLTWVDASSLYKTDYVDYIYEGGDLLDKNCVIMDSSRQHFAVSCNEEYRAVCAYNKLREANNKICGNYNFGSCRQSDYVSKSSCFCFDRPQYEVQGPKAEFLKLYQNGIFPTDEICSIGLEKNQDGRYIWSNTNQEITYTYWSPAVKFDDDNIYGAPTPEGWILTSSLESCSLVEVEIVPLEPVLELFFDDYLEKLVLSIMNPSWLQSFEDEALVFCFTDADSILSIYRFSRSTFATEGDESVLRYTFDPIENFPGLYWCEVFSFSNLEVVASKPYFYSPFDSFEFVGLFRRKIPLVESDPLNAELASTLKYNLLSKFVNLTINETDYVPRFMKVVDLDQENYSMLINLHFSSSLEIGDASDSKKEGIFQELKGMISELLNLEINDDVEMVDFFSADFCLSETITYPSGVTLTWPTSRAHAETASDEFCFRADGNLTTNICGGNFTDGLFWVYRSFVDCKILPKSSISKQLLLPVYLQDSISDQDMTKVLVEIETERASALDVYLLAQIYNKYFTKQDNFLVDTFRASIEIIFKLDPGVLLESQLTARATDKILYVIEHVLTKYQSSFQVMTSDYYFSVMPPGDVSGLAIQTVDGVRSVSNLTGDWDADRLLQELEDVEFAAWLNPALLERTIETQSLIAFTLYFDDRLFREGSATRNVSTVFGAFLTSPETMLGPISILEKINTQTTQPISCVSWFYDMARRKGLWMEDEDPRDVGGYRSCDFWDSANLAVGVDIVDDYNVTAELEGLMESDMANADKMYQLVDITDKHQQFNPYDVLLLGHVLDLVKNNADNDLGCLGKIVNNLHKVGRTVLSQSQEKHRATDLILADVDMIVKNYNNGSDEEILITTNNFLVFVTKKESNFTGLMLLESNRSGFEVNIVRGDFAISDIGAYDFASFAFLSPELRHQLPKGSTIIITAFFSDVLFNEEQSGNKTVSNIFGVMLPDVGNYSGPVSIVHDISSPASGYLMECSHWNYSTTGDAMSYWKKDASAERRSFLQCDFYHTTHFALLLLNGDDRYDYASLEWITVIASSISLAGLLLIVLTAILFQQWRRNVGNQILLNFSLAIILQLVTLYVTGIIEKDSDYLCTFFGALLHYTVISQFCWMLAIAVIQFKRFVQVFSTSSEYLLLKACLCGWLVPLILVTGTLVVDRQTYGRGVGGICYPSGLGLYLTVWLPIVLIITANMIIFIYIMYSVIRSRVDTTVHSKGDAKHQLRLFVLLFFMLGITWCFGFLAGLDGGGIVFVYLFSLTATLQGFVLFLYFILFNATTRRLYVRGIKSLCLKKDL